MWGNLFIAMLFVMALLCLAELVVYLVRRKR